MAHLIEQMAYVGQTPWHGLGNELTSNQPLEVWAKQAGLDWQIQESPVRFVTNSSGSLGEILSYPDSKVLYRSDTKAPLSVVGNRFKVVQPDEILEFYRDLTEVSGFELETAGVLKGGRKMWALARTGQSGMLKGNDQTNAYVLLATACDGTMATTAQFTSIRVVCNNTLAVALKGSTANAVKVKHNTAFDSDLVKKQLGISVSAWDEFMYRLRTLSERKVKTSEARNYFLRVFTDDSRSGVGKTNERSMAKALSLYEGEVMDRWAYERNIEIDFSRPGKPTDNATVESFNGRLRQECLNENWFLSLADAREKIEAWRTFYNQVRPHSALEWSTPSDYARKHAVSRRKQKQLEPDFSNSGWT